MLRYFQVSIFLVFLFSPRKSASFHVVCERDVVGPDVELPLPEPENSAVNSAGVNADSHVHVHTRHLANKPAKEIEFFFIWKKPFKFSLNVIIVAVVKHKPLDLQLSFLLFWKMLVLQIGWRTKKANFNLRLLEEIL